MRAGADERHLTPQNINKLRQFIQRRTPQQPTHRGHASIVLFGLLDDVAVLKRCHRAELPNLKFGCVVAAPSLPEEDGTLTLKFDGECDDEEDRSKEQKSNCRDGEIKPAFCHRLKRSERCPRQ